MSESMEGMRHKISGADNLESVVRIMKMIASSNIYQYENLKVSLEDYYHTVNLSLGAYFRGTGSDVIFQKDVSKKDSNIVGAIVFGGDNGLVGQFNELITEYTIDHLKKLSRDVQIWTVGEGVHERLLDAGIKIAGNFKVANSVMGITPLVGDILLESESSLKIGEISEFYVFYNSYSKDLLYAPTHSRILPLDEKWLKKTTGFPWPTKILPEVVGDDIGTLLSLIDEYLFVSVYKACAESLIAENASRLATAQRAEKNIGELIEELTRSYQMQRKNIIDEEMFDIVSGYESIFSKL